MDPSHALDETTTFFFIVSEAVSYVMQMPPSL